LGDFVNYLYNIIFFQYGVLSDIYSLAIILFELFSGMDPFPGNLLQIFRAKQNDDKPKVPLEFPDALKSVIGYGWSKKPRERPEIKEFISALSLMLQLVKEKNLTVTEETTLMGNTYLI
jgi:serine/threonine protein kinase